MSLHKPGRVLFWITVACVVLYFASTELMIAGAIDKATAGYCGFASFIGIVTGTMWVRLKWTQAKARAARVGWNQAAGR